jgi:2-oxo-3-hexenedioate decarboxylase
MLSQQEIERCAQLVDTAAADVKPIPMLTLESPAMTLEDAYTIQRASMARRFARGERLVGMKMGLTSVAKMEQMGVHNPIYGHLTDAMLLENGGSISHSGHCHPRTEPELCFVLKHDLEGPVTPEEAMAAVGKIHAALEIIDSRYKDFKFTLIDVVADNASSIHFVLGDEGPADLDISDLEMSLWVNGECVETGSSKAIYDHPARSLAAQVNMLAERGECLRAGQVVMSGGATKAVAVKPGDRVKVVVEKIGTAEFEVVA